MSDYNKLLEMWREEKNKRQEAEKEIEELRADNKKLAKEINDRVDRLRKAGLV
mgnify:FL=1